MHIHKLEIQTFPMIPTNLLANKTQINPPGIWVQVEEEKYNLQLNTEIKENIIKDMGTDIIIKRNKINALEDKLQRTIDKLTETTNQLDRERDNKNKKAILILADS